MKEQIDKKMKDIVADDITDITLIQAGYYWNAGYNEFDFICKIKGEDDVLHMREQRHDDGSSIVIRSEKDDIWERIAPSEVYKLDDKLQEVIQYETYHKRIEGITTLEDCKDLEFELMENDNVYLNRVLGKLWTELEAKQNEIEGSLPDIVVEFRTKTDERFHQIDGMSPAEIEGMVLDYVQVKIEENNLEAEIVGVVVSGSRCRGIEKTDSDIDMVLEYKGSVREDTFFDIEFYDDWGSGDNIKLDVYYRMCDEILAEMKNCPELLATNKSRYDGNLHLAPGELHPDTELHILLFDIIYCSHVYNLFDGITFARPKSKEKQLIVEQKNKARALKAAYEEAKEKAEKLDEALCYFVNTIKEAGIVKHKAYGECDVISADSKYLKLRVKKTGEEKQLGTAVVIANGIISMEEPGFAERKTEYVDVLKKADSIPRNLEYVARALEPYEEYLYEY